ncbi:MAG: helix-turn-helix domain-containing protein [Acetatifactor sp.]
MSLGEKLYRLRTERGIYQKELAAELHMSISGISSYENDIHVPDIKTLEKMARYFHVSTDYLLGRVEYMAPIDDMEKKLIDRYTVADLMDTIIELSPERRQDLLNYLCLLKSSENSESK